MRNHLLVSTVSSLELHPLQPLTPYPAYRNRIKTIPRMLPTSLPSSSLISSFQLSQTPTVQPYQSPILRYQTLHIPSNQHLSQTSPHQFHKSACPTATDKSKPHDLQTFHHRIVLFRYFLCLGSPSPHHLSRLRFPFPPPIHAPIHNLQTQSIRPQHFHPKIPSNRRRLTSHHITAQCMHNPPRLAKQPNKAARERHQGSLHNHA